MASKMPCPGARSRAQTRPGRPSLPSRRVPWKSSKSPKFRKSMIFRESPRASCECRQVPVRFAVAIRLRKAHFRCFSENFGVLVMSGARDPRRLGPRSGTSAPVRIIYDDPSENRDFSKIPKMSDFSNPYEFWVSRPSET